MKTEYDKLFATGTIRRIKRDIVLEASSDVMYLCHVQAQLERDGAADASTSAAFMIRLPTELLDNGLCQLAKFATPPGSTTAVRGSRQELIRAIEIQVAARNSDPFESFLETTPLGEQWVPRYKALIDEL
ncbi:MAG: hypothetical protein IPH13_15280 [Planctomycetes bacterium]|nr:hypothetical protein [Planctomycetota bacterium]MCC7172134.1 hypothetical protein [Planctomycetota bacterium]